MAEGVPLDTFNLASLPSDPLDTFVQTPFEDNLDTVFPFLSDSDNTAFLEPDDGSEGDVAFMDGLNDASLQPNLFSGDYVGK